MSYSLDFSDNALSKLERLGFSDAKKLRQVFIKVLSLRKNPYPQDSKQLKNFSLKGYKGLRVDQGEFRIIYAVNEKDKKVLIGAILNRNEDYKELKQFE